MISTIRGPSLGSAFFKTINIRHFCSKVREDLALLRHLEAKIKFSGPITVYEYMKEVLTNPLSGYYMKKKAMRQGGDFVTSPEISQMFGELVAIWMYNEWHKMGSPKPLKFVEFGPGTGALLKDILRTLKQLEFQFGDLELHLVEKSPLMMSLQEEALCSSSQQRTANIPDKLSPTCKSSVTSEGIPIHWHYHFSQVPKGFLMAVAHEFFDALPVHKLKKTEEGWREVLVDLMNDSPMDQSVSSLRYVLSRSPTPASKLYVDDGEAREELEVSPDALLIVKELSCRIEENGGAALIVDYGDDVTNGDTFRGYKNHKQICPLETPGCADLTCDVDFSLLRKEAAEKMLVYGPVCQSYFLRNMGIEFRLQKLLTRSNDEQRRRLISSYKMLTSSKSMGDRFKVMALLPKVMEKLLVKVPPAGFFDAVAKH